MDGEQRRRTLLEYLKTEKEPLSGGELAQRLGVSRQVIVQDIALLRAADYKIFSTNRGYLLTDHQALRRVFKVRHDDDAISDELFTIIDSGGRVLDVFVNHEIYGEIRANLFLVDREDVERFNRKMLLGNTSPLKHLTDDIHYHTVEGDSEEVLLRVEQALIATNYLES
jgi:transcriptional regulator of NAD metabolism